MKEIKFTKTRLQTGNIVQTRDGRFYLFLKNLNNTGYNYFIPLNEDKVSFFTDDDYNESLIHKSNRNSDIMYIHEPYDMGRFFHYLNSPSVIDPYDFISYKRQTPKELTVEEVSKLLGYPVKIIASDTD